MMRLYPLVTVLLVGSCLLIGLGRTPRHAAHGMRSGGGRSLVILRENVSHYPIVTLASDGHAADIQYVVAIDPDTPNRVTKLRFDSVGSVNTVTWTEDHAYLLLTSLKGSFLCRYDPKSRSFEPPVACPHPGLDPLIRWPAGFKNQESASEGALRRKMKPLLGPMMPETGSAFVWTPDRKWIAFATDTKENANGAGDSYQEIWAAQMPGMYFFRVGRGSHPHWSPDGKSLLTIDGDAAGGRQIVHYDFPKCTRTVLRSGKLQCFADAVYSASGDTIAVFGAFDPAHEGNEGVFLMDTQGHLVRKLAEQKMLGLITYPIELAW